MNQYTLHPVFRTVRYLITCIVVLMLLSCGGGGDDDDTGDGDTLQHSLSVTVIGQGTATLNPPGGTYNENTLVALIATADTGWSFSTWSGDAAGTTVATTVLMDADKAVTATFVQNQAQDTEAPSWPAGASAASADIGATFLSLTWDEAQDNEAVTSYRIFKNQVLMDTTTGNKTEIAVTGLSMDTAYTFSVEAGDAAGNWSAAGLSHTATTAAALPLDPEGTAPDLNTSTTTRMRDASAFLYTGPDAIQKGVEPGSIEDHRVAVIRGMVKDEDGIALSGVTVSILGMPQIGRTTTRADGAYDIAVNGGDLVKIFFEKNDFLPVKRQVKVPWQNYVQMDDVVMVQRDSNVTPVQLQSVAGAQSARGSVINDADGTRQATLVVPNGVSGELILADGTRQTLDAMNVRVTEFTVGPDGPSRMPAEMPPNIAYTYAMDLSIDESQTANAVDVNFDKPLYYYLENFLGFPAGIKVPTGYYDADRGVWVPSESGLVIKILSVNGNNVTIDSDGNDVADDAQTLAGLGFSDEEREKLAGLYAAGDTLWRVPIDHFSSWDCNFGAYPPSDADIPWFKPDKKNRPDPCKQAGSIIDTANMGLGESVALVGLPFKLYYRSNRMPGYTHSQEIRIWDDTVSDSLQRILVRLNVAGQLHAFEFEKDFFDAFPESFTFTWDGRDVYGREVQGSVPMIVDTGYVYDGEYEANESWGETIPDDVTATEIMVDSRRQIGLWNQWTTYIGGVNPRGLGLGGWMPDIHHAYDPASQTLFSGDGEQKSAEETDSVVLRVAGTGQLPDPLYLWYDDDNPATQVNLGLINDIAGGPDGSLYIAEGNRGVLRVTPDGLIRRITGDLITGTVEDGIEANQAAVVPIAIAIGPDESIYISENDRIRKITPDGLINTIAGDGQAVYGPEGGPAMGAAFEAWKIAVAPDGNVYILDMDAAVIRKIGTDDRLTLFAGIPNDDQDYTEAYTGEGGRAKSATFHLPMSMALGSDGSMYVADLGAHRVLRILPNGIITTAAGNGTPGNTGDGGPAVDASLMVPRSLTMGPDNALYIGCNGSVRKVAPNGIISTIGGGDEATGSDDGIPATQAAMGSIMGLVMGPAKNLTFFEGNLTIRKIATAFGDFSSPGEISIPDKDTNSIFIFDENGQHLRTVDIWTGAVQWEFEYNLDGHLWKIRDVDGDETIIDYDLSNHPTAITPPHAQGTSLTVNTDGYLEQISDPTNNVYQFVYSGTDGLLTEMTTPNTDVYTFEYYDDGRLKKDSNPNGGSQTLVRETLADADGYKVSVTTALGRETTYETAYLDEGGTRITKTYPHGRSKTMEWSPDAGQTVAYVDGTDITLQQGPDPRFGMQIPIPKLLTEATPGGLVRETRMSREIQLGIITDTISINDRSFSLVYDELSRTSTLTTPEGRENVTVLNDKGRIESIQVNAMAPTDVTYDSHGRAETISVDSRSYQMTYDGDGFLSMVIDPLLGETEFVRDAAGRILTKILPDDREISFGYDDNGNVRVVTPPGRPAHTLDYTSLDSLGGYDPPNVSGVSPDVTTFTYNLDGQITTINRPGSEDITITYDDAGRQLTFGHPHDLVTATYDGSTGKLTGLSTFEGIDLFFGWDGFLLTDVAWSGPFEKSLQGHYNNDFRITEIRIDGSSLASFSYDEDGLLIEAGSLSLTRDINGQVTHTVVGDITTDITYDSYGQLLSLTAETAGTPLMTFNYDYDLNGQITGLTETIQGVTSIYAYTYDAAGRLTNVTKDAVSVAACTFDSNSNRIVYSGDPSPATATYDEQDRMLTYGDAAYTYTDAGTLQTKTLNTDITAFDYDAAGNLRGVTLPDGTAVSYLIDGMNRRVGKQVDGSLAQGFIYLNQLAPIAELDGGGNVISRFVYGAKAHVPQLMIKGGITYRIISDHLGSPRLVVNTSNGTIAQRMDYDAFGRVIADTYPGFQPFGFAGGLYDSQTTLIRFGARDYDPETSRWTKKDPILFAGGDTNLYGYVLANPVNWIDPTGNVSPFDANGNLAGIPPGQFRRMVGREFLDAMPSSQAAADRSGGFGDSLLDAATMGTVSGKDLRQAAGVDIVNECSDTYKETRKYTDPVAQGVFAVHGAAGLRTSIKTVSRVGASKYLGDFHNSWDLGTGIYGSGQAAGAW